MNIEDQLLFYFECAILRIASYLSHSWTRGSTFSFLQAISGFSIDWLIELILHCDTAALSANSSHRLIRNSSSLQASFFHLSPLITEPHTRTIELPSFHPGIPSIASPPPLIHSFVLAFCMNSTFPGAFFELQFPFYHQLNIKWMSGIITWFVCTGRFQGDLDREIHIVDRLNSLTIEEQVCPSNFD